MSAVLVIARLYEPSSEHHIAEDGYRRTALEDLLGLPADCVNDDRLYRTLDRLLPLCWSIASSAVISHGSRATPALTPGQPPAMTAHAFGDAPPSS